MRTTEAISGAYTDTSMRTHTRRRLEMEKEEGVKCRLAGSSFSPLSLSLHLSLSISLSPSEMSRTIQGDGSDMLQKCLWGSGLYKSGTFYLNVWFIIELKF